MCSPSCVYQWLYIQTCLNINSLTIENVIIGFEYFKTTVIMIVNHNKVHLPRSDYYYLCTPNKQQSPSSTSYLLLFMWCLYLLNYFANRKGFIYIENTWVKMHNAYNTIIMDVHCSTWSFLQDVFFFQNMFDIGLTNVYLIESLLNQHGNFLSDHI